MSKSDFILAVAKKADLPKAEAKRVIELVFGTIEASLKGLKGGGKLPIGKQAPRSPSFHRSAASWNSRKSSE